MRKFTLINKDGTTYDITSKGSAFFYNVDGLGYEMEMKFQGISDMFALISEKAKQQTVTGTVRFWQPGAEQKYFEFYKFCKVSPLKMKYNPGHGDYFRNGYVRAITRGDGTGDVLTVTIEFACTSPWYKVVSAYNNGEITDGKVYDYSYDYTYTEGTPGSVIIDSDSALVNPCKLTIYGEAVNPSWSHYVDGKLIATGKVYTTIGQNRRLVIDTTNNPWRIIQTDNLGNFVSDLYQLSDFSTDRFIQIHKGRNVISVTDEGVEDLTLSVEVLVGYDTI